jgi:hypothetical protein
MQEELIQRITSIATSRRGIYSGISNAGGTGNFISVTLDNGLSVEARNINIETPGVPVGVVFDSVKKEYIAFSVENPSQLINQTPIISRQRRGGMKLDRINITASYIGDVGESPINFNLDVYPFFSEETKSNFPDPLFSLGNYEVPLSTESAPSVIKKYPLKRSIPSDYRIAGKPGENPKQHTYYALFGDNVYTTDYKNSSRNRSIYSLACTPYIAYKIITNGEVQVTYDFAPAFNALSRCKRFKVDLKIKNPEVKKIYDTIAKKYTIMWRLIEQRDLTFYAYGYIDEDGKAFLLNNVSPEEFNWETKIFTSTYDYDGHMCVDVGIVRRSPNSIFNYETVFEVGRSLQGNREPFYLRTLLKTDPSLNAALVDRVLNVNGVVDQFFLGY